MKTVLTVLTMVLAANAPLYAQAQQQPDNANARNGKTLYSKNCASCHGANLQGQENWRSPDENGIFPAPPHDVSGHTWHHGDGLLFDYSKFGGAKAMDMRGVPEFNSGMPAFEETLTDAELWDIWAYIKSTWPERMQAVQKERTQGELLEAN